MVTSCLPNKFGDESSSLEQELNISKENRIAGIIGISLFIKIIFILVDNININYVLRQSP